MPRRRTVAIISLAALIAIAPFLPRSHDNRPEGRITPVDGGSNTVPADAGGYGVVTPAMQAEIDRVVGTVARQPVARGEVTLSQLATQQVQCATFEGLTYCLGIGWTDRPAAEVQAEVAQAARTAEVHAKGAQVTNTGDLDPAAQLQSLAKVSPTVRAQQDRAELTEAARSVAKVWVLRHEVLGVPYPQGFLARHPEVAALTGQTTALAPAARTATPTKSTSASPSKTPTKSTSASPTRSANGSPSATATSTGTTQGRGFPVRDEVLDPTQVHAQVRSYWCGPGSTQMIVWGWTGKKVGQGVWASRLGTTTSGTAIGSIVSVINKYTGWDRPGYAGPYITLDIGGWTYHQWYALIKKHITTYRAPIVMHPILLKKYYPYLAYDASGHYQVGRGYDKRGNLPNLVSYFEPWNQKKFNPALPYIKRVQWHSAYLAFRANKAHPYHNLGV
jgi:hypothetical protein